MTDQGTRSPTVFIIDDELEVRNSLRWLIESVGLPVETFESAQDFLDRVELDRPGCVVLDIRMPGMGGLELQSWLAQNQCVLPIIIITGYADVPMAVRALSNGAHCFIEKPFSDQILIDRIHDAISQNQARRTQREHQQTVKGRLARLTARERSVFDQVILGKQNKEIAQALGVSEKTIEVHRGHMMAKMEARNVAELVRTTHGVAAEPSESSPTQRAAPDVPTSPRPSTQQ
ncbi:MAG: response regulator transcription factor [Planctomycetes bacterium]|nr:response regulator transcription factor [Planctomycetota bacterium]